MRQIAKANGLTVRAVVTALLASSLFDYTVGDGCGKWDNGAGWTVELLPDKV